MSNIGMPLFRCGALLLNLLIAIFGTAVIESVSHAGLPHPRGINSVLIRTYLIGVMAACLLGFLIYRRWRPEAAKWIWIVGLFWFAVRALPLAMASGHGGLWFQMSGAACNDGLYAIGCMNWFDFTIPAVRAVSYSAGAWLGRYFLASGGSSSEDVLVDALLARFHHPSFSPAPEDSETK